MSDIQDKIQVVLIERWYIACREGDWPLADKIWDMFQDALEVEN